MKAITGTYQEVVTAVRTPVRVRQVVSGVDSALIAAKARARPTAQRFEPRWIDRARPLAAACRFVR
jgi:hypothetical protein